MQESDYAGSWRRTDLTREEAVGVLTGLGTTRVHAEEIIGAAEHGTFGDTAVTVNGVAVWVDVAWTRSKPYSVRTPDQR